MFVDQAESIVLASASLTRRAMLRSAGVAVECEPSSVDEGALKRDCRARGMDAAAAARVLAEAKTLEVAARRPGKIVIGADQMLECGEEWFDKPADRVAARAQLTRLAGKDHRLISAAAAVRDGEVVWALADTAELTMRPLSAAFIDRYLERVGDAALQSVGGYQIEGIGLQLFSEIRGDHFTILGMPLLPVLEFLRREGAIAR
jgi:septum formation protein